MKLKTIFCLVLGLLSSVISADRAVAQSTKTYPESHIKVALVYKLIHFIEWAPNDPITLCVYMPTEEDIVSFRLMPSHIESGIPLEITLVEESETLFKQRTCQIVFFGKASGNDIQKRLTKMIIDKRLTIGESRQFINQGGMINLIRKDLTIKFEINISALKQANLMISSQVLRIADKVYSDK